MAGTVAKRIARLGMACSLGLSGAFVAGSGVMASTTITVTTVNQLLNIDNNLTDYLGATINLGANISLPSGTNWIPIGTAGNPFTGNFNGNGYSISGVTINVSSYTDRTVGFFGDVAGGTVENLTLSSESMSGSTAVNDESLGLLAGLAGESASFSNDTVSGQINLTTSEAYVGGAFGTIAGSTINSVAVLSGSLNQEGGGTGNMPVGGFVGTETAGSIANASTAMAISATQNGEIVGGFIGFDSGGSVTKSWASGNIVSNNGADVAGFVGEQTSGIVTWSSALGSVTAKGVSEAGYVGGFVGALTGGEDAHSIAAGAISLSTANSEVSVGGFAGESLALNSPTIVSAETISSIMETGAGYVGGFVGMGGGSITTAVAAGSITDSASDPTTGDFIGGFAGETPNGITPPLTIHDAYTTDSISAPATQSVGGFVGNSQSNTIISSVYAASPIALTGTGTLLNTGLFAGEESSDDDVVTDSVVESSGDLSLFGTSYQGGAGITDLTSQTLSAMQTAEPYQSWSDWTTDWTQSPSANNGLPTLVNLSVPALPLVLVPVPPASWVPPVLVPETVTVGNVTGTVIANMGYNSQNAVQQGTYFGYVMERAAVLAGFTLNGEGADSSYGVAILSGDGIGDLGPVSIDLEGQFAALYQKLEIIPSWDNEAVTMAQGVQALVHADAPTLAIENYLVQIWGFSWTAAQMFVATGLSTI